MRALVFPGNFGTFGTFGAISHSPQTRLPASIMSQSYPRFTPSSSSNLQSVFNNALTAYEKRTKIDLLAHPLAAQFQYCNTPGAVLALLQEQVQNRVQDGLNKSLGSIVNVLHTLSASLGENVILVCHDTILETRILFDLHRLSPQRKQFLLGLASSFQCVSFLIPLIDPLRQL